MRLALLFVGCLLMGFAWSQAQPYSCQTQHHLNHTNFSPKYKSGNESLRSDTTNVINYSVYLDFTNAGSAIIAGATQVKFEALMDMNTISLDLLQLQVDSVVHAGNPIPFSYNDTLLVPQFASTILNGSIDSVTVYYQGSPQTDPSGWGGFYFTSGYYYNLGVGFESEPHNYGRVWHPCFDNFVERATYDFEILTNAGNTAYCNGTRISTLNVGTDSTLTKWTLNTEIPTYLASVAVSDYTHVSQNYFSVDQGINIPIWLAAHDVDTTALKGSFINLNGALEAFENDYGPYVWERIGYVLVPFNAGAMEHSCNIAYPKATINGTTTYETLMAHELSHHWWGNWVTCETAEEMWINEGMAAYSERLFLEHVYDYDAYMLEMRDNHKNVLHRAHINDSGFYALNAVPLKYTYGDHSYNKGSDVMHTLRSYMGDAEFFAALQSIQTAYGGGTISTEQFRDHINGLGGVDVSDFFTDWMLQPGYSAFDVTHFEKVQDGANWNVSVVVDQKLKGASSYHNNVPMQITFIDDNWQTHDLDISLSGDYQALNMTVPIDPVAVFLNRNEKINHAITAEEFVVDGIGLYNSNYANARVTVDAVSDSALMRIEHHWVAPDNISSPANVMLSQDRYWTFHGVNLAAVSGEIRFEYNGRNNSSGDLDNSIMNSTGNQAFTEDSLVLLFRPSPQDPWEIVNGANLNTAGADDDKFGFMTTDTFMEGQYTFGYKTNSVGINGPTTHDLTYRIYPNPAKDELMIDLGQWDDQPHQLAFFTINGSKVAEQVINGKIINKVDVSALIAGTYIMTITANDGMVKGSKKIMLVD